MTLAPLPPRGNSAPACCACSRQVRADQNEARALRMSVRSRVTESKGSRATSRGPRHCANEGAGDVGERTPSGVLRKLPPRRHEEGERLGPCGLIVGASRDERQARQVTSVTLPCARSLRRSGADTVRIELAPTPPCHGNRRSAARGILGLPSIFQSRRPHGSRRRTSRRDVAEGGGGAQAFSLPSWTGEELRDRTPEGRAALAPAIFNRRETAFISSRHPGIVERSEEGGGSAGGPALREGARTPGEADVQVHWSPQSIDWDPALERLAPPRPSRRRA